MVTVELPTESSIKTNTTLVLDKHSGNVIEFDSGLIHHLENDHKELLDLYNQVLGSAKNNEFNILQLSLVEFATSFTTHIEIEDEQLYGYLIDLASGKSALEQKVVSDFADEMKKISVSIFEMLSQSPYIPVTKYTVSKFITEFEKIGEMLTDRIEREEKVLYPIYENSQARN